MVGAQELEYGRALRRRGSAAERAARRVLRGEKMEDVLEWANTGLTGVERIGAEDVEKATTASIKKEVAAEEEARKQKAADEKIRARAMVVKLAPGTEMTIIDGDKRRRAVTGG